MTTPVTVYVKGEEVRIILEGNANPCLYFANIDNARKVGQALIDAADSIEPKAFTRTIS